MESHPSYPVLSQCLKKYPHAAGSLFQTYNDLVLGQQWHNIEVIELPGCKRNAIKGMRPGTETALHVIPCSLANSISLSWIQEAFTSLSNPSEVYLAITSDDASIVYYRLSSGIVKPPM